MHDGGTKLTRTCGVCGVEFRLAQEFYDHIETHKGYLICEICGECLPDKDSFKHHNISHRKIDEKYKKVVCDLCGLKFLSDALLKSHMYTHSDLKSFICDECGKSFRFQSSLCVHKKSHNKQVECNVCHKMFASKQGLSFHYVMHTGKINNTMKLR